MSNRGMALARYGNGENHREAWSQRVIIQWREAKQVTGGGDALAMLRGENRMHKVKQRERNEGIRAETSPARQYVQPVPHGVTRTRVRQAL